MLDPKIVEALVNPVATADTVNESDEELIRLIAEGRTIKAIAAAQHTTPAAVSDAIEELFLKLAKEASAGTASGLRRLRMLHQAIIDREERGESLSRLLPGGVADMVQKGGGKLGETTELVVTVLMGDIRGYTTIAEAADPSALARQLNDHRAHMNHAILGEDGTVMQFVGDAVMAVFGAPVPQDDHPDHALRAALAMHAAQREVNERWAAEGLPAFNLGIGLSTGEVAGALLGSEERLEYTMVGDTVNLANRLQQWAEAGQTVLSEPTFEGLSAPVAAERLEPALVKGRQTPVAAYRIAAAEGAGMPSH
jgi:class 3 adenylate cyclase